ncbi:MAG: hypothetical protein LBJ00_10060 [Planctomycetaceae bacterium]|nr:hypothetical protein [Planctomycetaceae bacterium]
MFKGEAYRPTGYGIVLIFLFCVCTLYIQVVLKFPKLDTQSQQREAVVQGRSLPPLLASI